MRNPIFRNYRTTMLYGVCVTAMIITQTLVVHYIYGLALRYACLDAAVCNLMFALCLLPLWYPVYFNRKNATVWYSYIINNILHAAIFLLLSTGSSYLLLQWLMETNSSYIKFLYSSISWKILEGILLYIIVLLVYDLLIHIEQLKERAVNEIRLQRLLKDGELNLLKSQINPHFLFNSLNSVNALILTAPKQAGEMLIALSDYLRYTVLSTKNETNTLENELKNIERYLAIEKLRFGEKLSFHFESEESALHCKIPSMLLQPLFENAIKHGVYESISAVGITAKTFLENGSLHIEISNDFDNDNRSSHKGSGTGLKNVAERLRLTYGNDAFLQTKIEGNKFIATVVIK